MSQDLRHDVGVVVIGRNEGERLVRCLASLAAVGSRVVYVDSGSSDGSIAAARCAGAAIEELDTTLAFTAARARNAGFRKLRSLFPTLSYVQFVDGDCELVTGWLEQATAFLDAHVDVAVACGRRRERYPDASIYNRMCDIEWNTPVGLTSACGGDALMRVRAFQAVGGFDDALMAGEEPELCGRLGAAGWQIWRLDRDMTLHDAAMTRVGQWWMRSVRGGWGYAQVWRATRDTSTPLYGREVARAAFWGGVVPVATILAMAIGPAALVLGPGLYAAQIARVAARGTGGRYAWSYAFFAVAAKLPEFQGVMRHLLARRGQPRTSIVYK